MFIYSQKKLIDIASTMLDLARQAGATSAETDVYESVGQDISVRLQKLENIEYQQDTGLEIMAYVGHRKGVASTTDFSPASLKTTAEAAVAIARYSEEDACAELAPAERMAKNIGDLDIYHEWRISPEDATQLALRCEDAALSEDALISNSDGASVSVHHGQSVYANTHGFCAYDKRTRHGFSCTAVASDEQGMQRESWGDYARSHEDLQTPEEVGSIAAKRTLARLHSGSLKTGVYPVIFERNVARSLIFHLTKALSGSVLYRKRSFLQDAMGKKIMPDFVHLREEPHLKRTFSTTYFDDDGIATAPRDIIQHGEVQSYFLSHYTAKKLGMVSTANAGGLHHLVLQATVPDLKTLLQQMGTGLLITDLMGQGVNILTGDYSRGAAGFWVENGMIAYPVHEMTIAGNLSEMFRNILGIANDALPHSSHDIGSILIEKITVASA
ncbi:MAG: metalloprotease PmbA [Neisseriaceae bacterium]|nr:metalloprotease PmbA [Neisseriaceae bacterium]